GQVYRQGGRHREALREFESALRLRPDYRAAARAADELRREAAGPRPESDASPIDAAPAPPFQPFTAQGPAYAPAAEEELSPVWVRLLRAMGQLIASPDEAINEGLDRFFNSPGVVGAVC